MRDLTDQELSLIQNYSIQASMHFARIGVEFSVDPDLMGWVELMEGNAGSNVGINRAFDPRGKSDVKGFWLRADYEGRTVSCQAARFLGDDDVYRLIDTAELWNGPGAAPQPLPAPFPRDLNMTGRVVHTGGHWVSPEWRYRQRVAEGKTPGYFSEIFPRLTRSFCVRDYRCDHLFSFVVGATGDSSLVHGAYGWARMVPWFDGWFLWANKSTRINIVTATADEHMRDLSRTFLAEVADRNKQVLYPAVAAE